MGWLRACLVRQELRQIGRFWFRLSRRFHHGVRLPGKHAEEAPLDVSSVTHAQV
jgi:hypothetical protein